MPLILRVSPRLTKDELVARFLSCHGKHEKLRWQAVMLKAEGRTARDIADICKRKEDWVRRTVRRYNQDGPEGIEDGRRSNGRAPLLDDEQQSDLWEALQGNSSDGGLWTSAKVARWIEGKVGHPVDDHTGWLYLRRLGFTRQVPRPKHPDADEKAQEAFKKGGFRAVLTTSFDNTPTPKSRSGPRTKRDSG